MARKQLISSDEAVPASGQHRSPCGDCPWSRESLNGWLGGFPIDDWISDAHSECVTPCHTLNGAQCAGILIYRSNVGKRPRDSKALILPADREKVFASPMEFRAHHSKLPAKPGNEEAD